MVSRKQPHLGFGDVGGSTEYPQIRNFIKKYTEISRKAEAFVLL